MGKRIMAVDVRHRFDEQSHLFREQHERTTWPTARIKPQRETTERIATMLKILKDIQRIMVAMEHCCSRGDVCFVCVFM
jgi:hypothetical protein